MTAAVETIKLDIACGQRKQDGHVGIDIAADADVVHDLEQFPWPFADESVSEAHCSHYIEHTQDLLAFMDELYRILVPGGQCVVIAPYYTSVRAWQDPTHTRAISEASFLYFNKEWRARNKLDHYPVVCDFDFEFGFHFYEDWQDGHSDEDLRFAVEHYWNVVADIQVRLTKRTNGET